MEKLEKALAASEGRSKDIITYPTKRAKAESELDDFMNSLKKANIKLDRRVLANIAAGDEQSFADLVEIAKQNAA